MRKKKPAVNSVKRDIDCLVRLYHEKEKSEDPEEVIQSPLSNLGLIEESKGFVIKRSPKYKEIGSAALMYCLLSTGAESLTLEQLETEKGLLGKVFNLKRNEIIKAIEELSLHPYCPLKFDRTNRLDTIRIPDVSPLEFLNIEYSRKVRKLV